jgi:hypothetical protein
VTSVIVGATPRTVAGSSLSALTVCGPAVLYNVALTNLDVADRYFRLMDGYSVGGRPATWPPACYSLLIPAGETVPVDFGVHGMLFQQAVSIACTLAADGVIVSAPFQYAASVMGI